MLPVGKRPVVDYIVQDLLEAGITDIYFSVSEQSAQLQSYYRSNIPLNDYLRQKGKEELLDLIAPLTSAQTHFILQPTTGEYGTAIPARITAKYIDQDESALFVYGDQFFYRADGGSNAKDLIALAESRGLTTGLLGNPVPRQDIPKYGVIEKNEDGNFVRIVEKPNIEDAPSNLNNSGFFLLNKQQFDIALSIPENPAHHEYQITDVINQYVAAGGEVVVGEAKGEYMECGSVDGWLHANNVVAGRRV